jgi:hypothetical protein
VGTAPSFGAGLGVGPPVGAVGVAGEEAPGAVVVGVADGEPVPGDVVGAAGELSAVGVAGAVVAGVDGAVGVVARPDEVLVSSPRVVVCDPDEEPTSADTGFCPMSSMPVTMPIATTKTATA